MVLLALIRDQHRLSLGSYGRPRMTKELNELGLQVGHALPLSRFACKLRKGAADAPELHSSCRYTQVQGGGGLGNDPGDHFPDDALTAITPSILH